MKKLALSIIACLAFASSAYAATSPLVESLLEIQAITNAIGAPDQDVIDADEFVTRISRDSDKVESLGRVEYLIRTYEAGEDKTRNYKAILCVQPNPGIGPNIITVLKIKKVK